MANRILLKYNTDELFCHEINKSIIKIYYKIYQQYLTVI